MKTAIGLFAVCALALTACGEKGFRVAEGGRVVADIVIPVRANQIERYAAEELAYHIDKAFGVRPETVTEDKFVPAAHRCHFFVGATEAAKRAGLRERPYEHEERRLKSVGNALFLLGGDVEPKNDKVPLASWAVSVAYATSYGTLYAVYDFLENEMGVKWIWPGTTGEVIPRRSSLACSKIDRGGIEPLWTRRFSCRRCYNDSGLGFSSRESRKKYYHDRDVFLLRHRICSRERFRGAHAFNGYWKRFGETHPEFFNLLPNGKREPIYKRSWGAYSMCVSEPGLWKQVVADWLDERKELMKQNDGFKPRCWVQCYENDLVGCCLCERCRSWDAQDPRFAENGYWNGTAAKGWETERKDQTVSEDFKNFHLSDMRIGLWCKKPGEKDIPAASLSDRYVKFYNSVLREAKKHDPAARVIGYAYNNYTEPPRETAVDPDVVIEYVSPSYFPYNSDESKRFRNDWTGWRRAGVRDIVHRPNVTHALGILPIDQSRRIVDDFAFAFTNGMFACAFDSLMESFSTLAMPNYALTRVMREPLRGYDAARADMVSAFGKAGPAMNRYFDYVENFTTNWTYDAFLKVRWDNVMPGGRPGGAFDRVPFIVADFISESFLAEASGLLAAARRAAEGDADVIARINYLQKGLRHIELLRNCRVADKAYRADQKNAVKKAAFERSFAELVAYRGETEGDALCNLEKEAYLERMYEHWPHVELHKVK